MVGEADGAKTSLGLKPAGADKDQGSAPLLCSSFYACLLRRASREATAPQNLPDDIFTCVNCRHSVAYQVTLFPLMRLVR